MHDEPYTPRPGDEPGCPQCGDSMDYELSPPTCMNCGFTHPDSAFMTLWDREVTENAQYWNDGQLLQVYQAWTLLWAELDLEDRVIEANDLNAAFQRLLQDRDMGASTGTG